MNTHTLITLEQLQSKVQSYEENILKAIVQNTVSKSPLIIKFKGVRKSKLVAITKGDSIEAEIKSILEASISFLDQDGTISENIEVFTLGVVHDNQKIQYNVLYQEKGLSLSITDRVQMETMPEFECLFKSPEQVNADIDTSLYEYLSMSNDTTDAKNSLFYSLLMMTVYQNQPIQKGELESSLMEKYGSNIGDVGHALKQLRRDGKIAPPGKGNSISLTDTEKVRLERSLKDEKAIEIDFKTKYNRILAKYGINDGEQILDALRDAYQAQYQWHSKQDDDERKKDDISREHFNKIKSAAESLIGEKANSLIQEIIELCDDSNYLNRYCLSHSFLQLFRSPGYKQYIESKESLIFLDTTVVAYFFCYFSGIEDDLNFSWDNPDYQNVKTLINIQKGQKEKIYFFIPYDYLLETVGEIKKSLQFSWFDTIGDLPVPFETGNTFYNFYLACKSSQDEKEYKSFTYNDFMSKLGIEELNPNSSLFNKRTYTYLKFFFNKYGCEIIEPISTKYDLFDVVREDYSNHLKYKERKKTSVAMNSDVRQAFYIANEFINDTYRECDYFLTSWDKTLRTLRDIVNTELALVTSYSIMTPGSLANKLALRHFQVNKTSVSNDVFAYAEKGYNFTTKVQSLYDNVLTPYFANANNHNSALVISMLKMEKACQDTDIIDDDKRKENTILGDIFLQIVYSLPDYDLSSQNLRDFLANKENNEFIINLFNQAFEARYQGKELDISESFCLYIKNELSKNDYEITL